MVLVSGGKDFNMERLRMLVKKIWAYFKLYFTTKRYHLKWNRLDYQLPFRKGAWASRLDSRDWQKLSQTMETI